MLFATLRTSFSRGALNRLQNCDVRNLLCVSRNCSNLNKGIPKGGIEVDPQKLLLFVHPEKGITATYWVKLLQ